MQRDAKGRFIKGHHYSSKTEFKKGEHWRKPKLYWNRIWLFNEYRVKGKSAQEIASQFSCEETNILYWLHKHNIPVRTISEAREIKHWGLSGEENGMYGSHGPDHPGWKGGVTPERQAFYSSEEWKGCVKTVWKRDNAQCQRCGEYQMNHRDSPFHIHHIVAFADSEELRCCPDNLVLLCPDCHHWVHSNDNEERQFMEGGI